MPAIGSGPRARPSPPGPAPVGAVFDPWLIAILAAAVLAGHVTAYGFPRTLWGVHSYAFFPPAVLGGALAATLAAVVAVARSRFAGSAGTDSRARWRRWWRIPVVSLVAFAAFWAFRVRHTLLGDAGPLTMNLPLGEYSHPRQPLTLMLHHLGYELAERLGGAGRKPAELAFDSVAMGSALAGVAFVWVAWSLSRQLASARETRAADPGITIPLLALLLTQGYMLLFFGYVENYTLFALALCWYLLEGLRFLDGAASFTRCSLALLLAVALNLSGLILLPSLAVLAVRGLGRHAQRRGVIVGLVVAMGLALGLDTAFTALGGGYDARSTLRAMWHLVARGQGGPGTPAYLLTAGHLRDVANVLFLIGPFAGALFLPLAVHRAVRGRLHDGRFLFLLGAALPPLAVSWLFAEPPLGFPRDWDLFAPYGVAYVAAAAHCLVTGPLDSRLLARLTTVAATVSVFHTAPWVALNTSEALALERFKNVPQTLGREEFYVGHWYLVHQDLGQAREWFGRAVAVSPSNNEAQYYLGLFAMDDGHYEEAASRFQICVGVRPTVTRYRFALVDALVLAGHPGRATGELERLIEADPTEARYWACYGIVLAGAGRPDESRHAFERALGLAPGDSTYARLLARAGDSDAYPRAVREDWDHLVVR